MTTVTFSGSFDDRSAFRISIKRRAGQSQGKNSTARPARQNLIAMKFLPKIDLTQPRVGPASPRTGRRGRPRPELAKYCARLPIHLAHPLKDEHAVVIHALGPSLQGSRQNRGEPCRLFPADTPSRTSVVVTTRRLCTIDTRAPFNHVEIDLQNAPLAEDEFGHRYQCELRTLAEDRAARSEK